MTTASRLSGCGRGRPHDSRQGCRRYRLGIARSQRLLPTPVPESEGPGAPGPDARRKAKAGPSAPLKCASLGMTRLGWVCEMQKQVPVRLQLLRNFRSGQALGSAEMRFGRDDTAEVGRRCGPGDRHPTAWLKPSHDADCARLRRVVDFSRSGRVEARVKTLASLRWFSAPFGFARGRL